MLLIRMSSGPKMTAGRRIAWENVAARIFEREGRDGHACPEGTRVLRLAGQRENSLSLRQQTVRDVSAREPKRARDDMELGIHRHSVPGGRRYPLSGPPRAPPGPTRMRSTD